MGKELQNHESNGSFVWMKAADVPTDRKLRPQRLSDLMTRRAHARRADGAVMRDLQNPCAKSGSSKGGVLGCTAIGGSTSYEVRQKSVQRELPGSRHQGGPDRRPRGVRAREVVPEPHPRHYAPGPFLSPTTASTQLTSELVDHLSVVSWSLICHIERGNANEQHFLHNDATIHGGEI